MNIENSFGLVFTGGGGKGAYQIGVWKALLENNNIKIGGVSGTSVGALNAALYAAGDFNLAEEMWLSISNDIILSKPGITPEKIFTFLSSCSAGVLAGINIFTLSYLSKYIISRKGMFSREGLIKLIDKSNITKKLIQSKIPCYAACYNLSEMRIQYFQLNYFNLTENYIKLVLLASSAIPVLFPKEKVGGAVYCDGGICDNVPIKPLLDSGWRKFIIIHLDRNDEIDNYNEKFKECQFIHIFPQISLGKILDGTLDFNIESIRKRIEQGYSDMKNQIRIFENFDDTLNKTENTVKEINNSSNMFYNSISKEFSIENIDSEISKISYELSKSKSKINEFVLKSVTVLSSSNAFLDEKKARGFLLNIFNSIIGKNKKLQMGIERNLIDIQDLTLKLILKLLQRDSVTIELIRAVQNQLQSTHIEMNKSFNAKISKLNENNLETNKKLENFENRIKKTENNIEAIYSIIDKNIQLQDIRIENSEREIKNIKYNQRLQNWLLNLEVCEFCGKEYKNLDIVEKIICVVKDFFYITNGDWDNDIILFVKSALVKLNVETNKIIAYKDVICKLYQNDKLRKELFDKNNIKYSLNNKSINDIINIIPNYEILIQGPYIGKRFIEYNKDSFNIERYLERKGIFAETGVSAFDMSCELLIVMKINHLDKHKGLGAYREIEKMALLGDLDSKKQYISLLFKNNNLEEANRQKEILNEIGINKI